jgi:hypothetical protein
VYRLAQEREEFAVDLLSVGDVHDVRPAVDLDVPCVGQRGVQPPARASIGRIRSAVPCRTSIGASMRVMSPHSKS